jgi:hypothetical protein
MCRLSCVYVFDVTSAVCQKQHHVTSHQDIVQSQNLIIHSSARRHGIKYHHPIITPSSIPSLGVGMSVLVHAKRVLGLVHEALLGAAVHSLVLACMVCQYVCLCREKE